MLAPIDSFLLSATIEASEICSHARSSPCICSRSSGENRGGISHEPRVGSTAVSRDRSQLRFCPAQAAFYGPAVFVGHLKGRLHDVQVLALLLEREADE